MDCLFLVLIDHTSPMVKGLHYDDAQVGRSSERSLASIYLNHLSVNPIFQKLEENERLLAIKNRLQVLG